MRICSWLLAWLCGAVLLPAAAARPLEIVATTGMVGDLVRRVGGDEVQVTVLMGPGVDPHLYRVTPRDVRALQAADAVFHNGLMLEGKMSDVLSRLGRRKPVRALAEHLPSDQVLHKEDEAHPDPHVWHDVALWGRGAGTIQAVLSELRPSSAASFAARAARLEADFAQLDAWVRSALEAIPTQRRVLVTSHDAFGYFGRAYGLRVVALQGLSTATEAGLADVARLSDFLRQEKVPAIFVESTVSPQAMERIAADTGVRIGAELYSDALGPAGVQEEGFDLGTYEGMIRANVRRIVSALQ